MQKRFALFLIPVWLAWGQLTPNSITVTATKNASLQPDEVVFGVTVNTTLEATRDEVIAALQGSGIKAENFSDVRNVQQFNIVGRDPQLMLAWTFQLPVALSNMRSAIDLLTTVQRNAAGKKNIVSISFGAQGTRVSSQLQRTQSCALSDLIADARAQATKLSAAARMGVGAILAMSSSTLATDPDPTILFGAPTYFPTCSLTVKFELKAF